MKLDSSAQEDAQRLGGALVEGAKRDADRLQTAAREAAEGLEAKARAVEVFNKGNEGTLLGTAAAVYAKEFLVTDDRQMGAEPGWPLEQLELRFPNQYVVKLCEDRNTGRRLPPGRYRALLVFTRIDE